MRDVAQHVAQREQYRRSTGRKSLLRRWNLSLLSLSSVRAHLLRGVSEPAFQSRLSTTLLTLLIPPIGG
jgi:hypothetical protein